MAQGASKNNIKALMDANPTALLEFYLIYYNFPTDNFNFIAVTPSFNRTDFNQATSNGNPINLPSFAEDLGLNLQVNSITWQNQQYLSMPVEGTDFAAQGEDQLPRPRLKISNKDLFMTRYIVKYGDLGGAKVIRKRVFAKFLDDVNFLPARNPFGTADPEAGYPDEVFYINRKTAETRSFVEFELSTSLEMDNIKIPNRVGTCRQCNFTYRGYGCRYKGEPKTDATGGALSPVTNRSLWTNTGYSYSVGDFIYLNNQGYQLRAENETDIIEGSSIEDLRTFFVCVEAHDSSDEERPNISDKWTEDVCEKTISACATRFVQNLPFGGFPGTYEYNSQQR